MTDPNWLLATMAQSAAAMVAVIGGFLVSRVISLSSERRGLERRLWEIRDKADDTRRSLAEVSQQRREASWLWFVDSAVKDCAQGRGGVSPEKLAEDHRLPGVSLDETVHMAHELNAKMQDAFSHIEAVAPPTSSPRSSPDPRELISRSMGAEFVAMSGRRSDIKERMEIPQGEERVYWAALDVIAPPDHLFSGTPAALVGAPAYIGNHGVLVEEEAELTEQLSGLEREDAYYDSALARVARPSGLGRGLGALVYLTIVGVIVPVVALASRPVPSGLVSRRMLVALFISGLVALFVYLIGAVQDIQRDPSRDRRGFPIIMTWLSSKSEKSD